MVWDELTSVARNRVYPQWTGRRDKMGLPVYVFKVAHLTKEVVNAYTAAPERLTPRLIALYEVGFHPARTALHTQLIQSWLIKSTWFNSSYPSHLPFKPLRFQRPRLSLIFQVYPSRDFGHCDRICKRHRCWRRRITRKRWVVFSEFLVLGLS